MNRFIPYHPIRGGNDFNESAINFIGSFLHNLRIIEPGIKEQNRIEGTGLISSEFITGEGKKIKVFLTPVGISILKEKLENDKWLEKANIEITSENEIDYHKLLN